MSGFEHLASRCLGLMSATLVGHPPEPETLKFKTVYMDAALFDLESTVEIAALALNREKADTPFDTLIGTGLSGSLIIPALALRLGVDFAILRKDTDDSHHGRGCLVGTLGKRWIFVDDFICSGRTLDRVISAVEAAAEDRKFDTENVGAYLYRTDQFKRKEYL